MRTAILTALLAVGCADSAVGQIAVRGETVHTVSGKPIKNGVVVIKDGKITAVGPAASTGIPNGYEVLEAKVVTPGLIDARTVVGLAGHLNQAQDQDQLDKTGAIQPDLRAVDAYNAKERLVAFVRSLGVTTLHTGHAPGALISGQTMIVKTAGATVEDAVRVELATVACTLGPSAQVSGGKPSSKGKVVAMLRSKLMEATRYASKSRDGGDAGSDPALDVLAKVLAGKVPLMVTAHKTADIMTALRLQKEFGFKLILDGASEAHMVLDAIRNAKVPVIAHAPMMRSRGEKENATFELGARLKKAGIPFAFQSGYESYVPKTRIVLFEAAIAAANGLGFDGALHAITLGAAKILGIDATVGSLEVGKDADIALYDGDPFEYTSHCVGVIIDGKVASKTRR